ncbi:hypothetical protein [Ruegeria lacuscaerulensis]|uniref:hypothetical protein n=1 Tax=Ruegeria lacuscaerulensis TaxID=55218 RepID=UPI00147BADFF|nr:hypothetical protein [Ruegeria lacuscaerulensis]
MQQIAFSPKFQLFDLVSPIFCAICQLRETGIDLIQCHVFDLLFGSILSRQSLGTSTIVFEMLGS